MTKPDHINCSKAASSKSDMIDEDGRIARSVLCRRCAYDLRGLAADSVCPECSLAIMQSTGDETLSSSDPKWLGKLAIGCRLYSIGAALAIVVFVGSIAVSIVIGIISRGTMQVKGIDFNTIQIITGLVGGVTTIVVIIGAWLMTERDPRNTEESWMNVRYIARFGMIANLLFTPWSMNIFTGGGGPASGGNAETSTSISSVFLIVLVLSGSLLTIATVVGWAAYYLNVVRLARRIPSPGLARGATFMMWGYTISIAMLFISSLGGMVMMLTAGPPTGAGQTGVGIAYIIFGLGSLAASLLYLLFEFGGIIIHVMLGRRFRAMLANVS